MAILNGENDLSFEIRYDYFGGEAYDWIQYLLFFRRKGIDVVRETDLNRGPENSPHCALRVEDCKYDYILPLVKMALRTEVPVYHEMLEDGLTISIFPHHNHPLLNISTENYSWSREEAQKATEEMQARYDLYIPSYFAVILEFHPRIFAEDSPFASNGLLFRIYAQRREVERFCEELNLEYQEFSRKFDLESFYQRRYPNWKPMI